LGFGEAKYGEAWCNIDLNELVLTFDGSYVCANFGKNRSRNATVRVLADGYRYTDTLTDVHKPIL